MKKSTFRLLIVCLLFSAAFTRCKCGDETVTPKTLKEKLANNTYILGTVTQGGTSKTQEFTGFKMVFNGDATSVTITTGGTTSAVATTACNVGDGVVTLSSPPTTWSASLSNASSSGDVVPGPDFKFNVSINNPKTGQGDYRFELVKQ
jgi:hypothetical protein